VVGQWLPKPCVAGSNPVIRSIFILEGSHLISLRLNYAEIYKASYELSEVEHGSVITGGLRMDEFSMENLEDAHRALSSLLHKCEKAQTRIEEGSSQHTLLQNRIDALGVALSLIKKAISEACPKQSSANS
jgi:hypothetical protein